jgi:tannase/feruloyl esterase
MLVARISELLTLAAITIGGSMAAMKTQASAADAGAILPIMSCEALANLDLTPLDARITATATVTRNGHSFCDVKGYISPVTQFEALLPTETWRGDYLQQGCGGLCGKADVNLDDPSRTSGYQAPYVPLASGEMVVAADDQGHEACNATGFQAIPHDGIAQLSQQWVELPIFHRSDRGYAGQTRPGASRSNRGGFKRQISSASAQLIARCQELGTKSTPSAEDLSPDLPSMP